MWYNDSDPYCAAWLRNLIAAGHLPSGEVDGRDIREVSPDELKGHETAHFFAGIGGWPLALKLAGWEGPIWTASIPCQPLSSAGRRKGHADERHLWPAFYRLVAEYLPPTIFGEQVASKDGREWLSGVRADLEALGYAVGAADLCAAGVGAPHIRQRLWWVAYADDARRHELRRGARQAEPHANVIASSSGSIRTGGLGVTDRSGSQPREQAGEAVGHGRTVEPTSDPSGLGDASSAGLAQRESDRQVQRETVGAQPRQTTGRGSNFGFWSAFDLIPCADGKARRVEPGTFPLASGISNRVGRLRAYGNAIVPQVAAEFVKAVMDCKMVPKGRKEE